MSKHCEAKSYSRRKVSSPIQEDHITYELENFQENASGRKMVLEGPQKPVVHKRSFRVSQRIQQLAKPRIRTTRNEVQSFSVRPSTLTYNITHRIGDLALPKRYPSPFPTRESISESVSQRNISAKSNYVMSERMKNLCQPKRRFSELESQNEKRPMAKICKPDSILVDHMSRIIELTRIPKHKLYVPPTKQPGMVSYNALVCRATQRMEELAAPRIRRDTASNPYAFTTKPTALRYIATDHINSLAVARTKDLPRSSFSTDI